MNSFISVVRPDWNAPSHVKAFTTERYGGVSEHNYRSLNLAVHVEDIPEAVDENRRILRQALSLPGEPKWLRQMHSSRCIDISQTGSGIEADGAYTKTPGQICAVLTADCLPLFISDISGEQVGVFHIGWRGLASGMVETATALFDQPAQICCWLGPAIGPKAFEIGPEVYERLLDDDNEDCFTLSTKVDHWVANLYRLVEKRLRKSGVKNIHYDESLCTYRDEKRFFSYRRQNKCGRMASLIWIES